MLIEMSDVSKTYGNHTVLKDINLALPAGHVYGLVGANSAGKSSLIRLITGSHFPTRGTVRVLGYDVRLQGELALAQIGYCPENSPLYPDMTIYEYLHFIGAAKGLNSTELKASLEEVLESFELAPSRHKINNTLSHGFRQRVGLAQAFLGHPELVVLDEPTNGLDPHQVIAFRHFLQRKAIATSLFFSSHVLSEVENVCDTLIMIADGEIKAVGTPVDIAKKHSALSQLELYLTHSEGVALKVLQTSKVFNLLALEDVSDGVKILVELKAKRREEDLFAWVKEHDLTLKSMIPQALRVESLFYEITKKEKT